MEPPLSYPTIEDAIDATPLLRRDRVIPKGFIGDDRLRDEILGEMKRRDLSIGKLSTHSSISVARLKEFLLTANIPGDHHRTKTALIEWLRASVNEDGREPSPAARGASKTRIESTIQKVDDVDLAAIAAEARGGRTTDWRAVTPTPQPIATVEEAPIEALERVISIPKGVTDLRIVLRFE